MRADASRQELRGVVELGVGDVGVAAHRGEVGVAEVLGHEARVARDLAQPRGGGVAQRMRGDVLLQSGARCGASDDAGEDRGLKARAAKAAEHRIRR